MITDKKIKKILIVDNDNDLLNITSEFLQNSGYNVITADSGETAVELAFSDRDISLILMDVALGSGIDGSEAARRILKKINVPIVFHTVYPDQEMIEKVNGITRYGYVIKSSGNFLLKSNIEIAFELFDSNKKIEKNGKLFRGLFNHSPNGVALIELIYNEQGKISDGIILAVNPALEKSTGLSADVITGKNYIDVYPKVLETDHLNRLDEMVNNGEPYFSEEYYEPTGKFFDFWAYEIDKGLIATVMVDVTDEKLARKSLVESAINLKSLSFLHQITDNIPAGVACVNAHNLKYIFVNKTHSEIFGLPVDMMVGSKVRDILGDEAFIRALPFIERACNGELLTYENIIPTRGEMRCFKIDYIPQPDKNGIVQFIVILAIDVTERNRKDEKILTLLNEKEILIKEVHHRIKNNMSTISGILCLQSDAMKDPAAVAALHDAQSRVHSMMVLYDKLYRADNISRMSLKEYLSPLIDDIIGSFPDNKTIKTEKNIDDFIINESYLFPLGIIINELITNIMKYAFDCRDDCRIDISAAVRNEYATVVIKDNGSGIPESINFDNAKGFGLQLVSILTNQIKGTIKIERENGTRVILVFHV